jgi:hypothetical protein
MLTAAMPTLTALLPRYCSSSSQAEPAHVPDSHAMGLTRCMLVNGMSLAVVLNLSPHWQVLRILQAANNNTDRH